VSWIAGFGVFLMVRQARCPCCPSLPSPHADLGLCRSACARTVRKRSMKRMACRSGCRPCCFSWAAWPCPTWWAPPPPPHWTSSFRSPSQQQQRQQRLLLRPPRPLEARPKSPSRVCVCGWVWGGASVGHPCNTATLYTRAHARPRPGTALYTDMRTHARKVMAGHRWWRQGHCCPARTCVLGCSSSRRQRRRRNRCTPPRTRHSHNSHNTGRTRPPPQQQPHRRSASLRCCPQEYRGVWPHTPPAPPRPPPPPRAAPAPALAPDTIPTSRP
jgi:hypothetical protein